MDKYLVRIPKTTPYAAVVQSGKKQVTLESLKGVVVIEDILRHKAILEFENNSKETVLKTLLELEKKQPSKEILLSTKIGRSVKSLCKHSDSEISTLAMNIYISWKSHILSKENKPKLEVRSDPQTEKTRACAKKWLSVALSEQEGNKLVIVLEAEVFHSCNRLVRASYCKTVRKMTFALKHNKTKQEELKNGKLSVQEFVRECKR